MLNGTRIKFQFKLLYIVTEISCPKIKVLPYVYLNVPSVSVRHLSVKWYTHKISVQIIVYSYRDIMSKNKSATICITQSAKMRCATTGQLIYIFEILYSLCKISC